LAGFGYGAVMTIFGAILLFSFKIKKMG
jgi:hypothetical protein